MNRTQLGVTTAARRHDTGNTASTLTTKALYTDGNKTARWRMNMWFGWWAMYWCDLNSYEFYCWAWEQQRNSAGAWHTNESENDALEDKYSSGNKAMPIGSFLFDSFIR